MAKVDAKTKKRNKPAVVPALVPVEVTAQTVNAQSELSPARGWLQKIQQFTGTTTFARLYVAFALLVLLSTTMLWSVLGARLHAGNADQLVNSYLFENGDTFKDATLPGQHTFLFKWPLFLLIKMAGFSGGAFMAVTVGAVLATVFLLAWLLYRIERRPLVFGTICLGLASALLLVPAQPYAGALLPVNMAMLATRNLEYILYILGLVLFLRAPSLKRGKFWLGVGIMSVLIASDKLFLTVGIGAALLALFVYALARRWELASFSAHWLFGQLAAGVGGAAILWAVNSGHITHIASQVSAGPYGLVHSAHGLVIGGIYAALGFLTNLGANPAFDAQTLRGLPHQAVMHLKAFGLLPFTVNLLVFAAGLYAAVQLVRRSLLRTTTEPTPGDDAPSRLSIMMIGTTLAACAVFVASNHYYTVDARYLAIGLFTIFISLATVTRSWQLPPKRILLAGAVITLALGLGTAVAVHTYTTERGALAVVNGRDSMIAKALAQRRVKLLVGDYWRVIPSRLASDNRLRVMPLATCTEARQVLSSKAWQPELRTHGFAYLLSFDQKLTDYPTCTLKEVVAAYGRPNASSLIAGTLANPKELLLFYDHGSLHSAPKILTPRVPSTVLPISLEELPNVSCLVPSSMNIVAHEDDDLLFMNPDVSHEIKAGHCVRTIYITAGDAGSGSFYWIGRQQGAEAAYASMLGAADLWVQRIVRLPGGQYITVANPRGNSRVSLIFMNLPDGNLKGEGFSSSSHEGLARLEAGQIKSMRSVDGQSTYTSEQLVNALSDLMHTYQPAEIRTQANFASSIYPDHSDHMAVGRYAKKAYHQYEQQQFEGQVTIPISYYVGYPIHQMAPNVSGADLDDKTKAFAAYTQFDGAVCITAHPCRFAPVFEAYLTRQYRSEE